jgi:hypothetical protein
MAEAGVALVTHGAGGLTMPPIQMLRTAGVLVFCEVLKIGVLEIIQTPTAAFPKSNTCRTGKV